MDKSEFLELNLPSRDNTTDIADINAVSDNFEIIDGAFLDLVEKVIPELQTKENINLNFDDDSTNEEQYPSVPAVVNFTNIKVDPLKIVNSASGNAIALKDSAKDKLVNLKLYGKTIQDGTPTPDTPVPLVSVGDSGSFEVGLFGGKNFLEVNITSQTSNGITYTKNSDNTITENGTATGTSQCWFNLNVEKNLIVGKTYKVNNCIVQLTKTDGKQSYSDTTFQYTNEIIQVKAYLQNNAGTVKNNAIVKPMISLADETDTTYEPCNKQTLTMPYTLRSVGDIKDEVDFTRGVLIQNIGELELNGNELWKTYGSNRFACFDFTATKNMATVKSYKDRPCFLCSALPVKSAEETNSNNTGISQEESVGISVYVLDDFATVEEWSAYLQSNPATLVYKLETPQETPLTETELNAYKKLHTNKPTTTILSEADMEVSYVADTKLYIDNKLAELTALTLEV